MSDPANETIKKPIDPRMKKQILLVFLLSMILSSLLIFFYVAGRTTELNRQAASEGAGDKAPAEVEEGKPESAN